MPSPVIRVEDLWKQYAIGGPRPLSRSFRETLSGALSSPLARLRRLRGQVDKQERIWALRQLSFDVAEGEVVGIIGRNGAGKSTLLKVLSRITAPTRGRVTLRGRVASLLEVGTGFHPELTGRENIYLNGALLGMSRSEIAHKFDEIVAFSGVEKFLETPVKRFSSGMYVRLAFAVAAHLEPEILLVDEVLAVGDAAFQKKCIGKLDEVAYGGRTVLFISHNMVAMQALCSRALLIDAGSLYSDTDVASAIRAYGHLTLDSTTTPLAERRDRRGSGLLRFVESWFADEQGRRLRLVTTGQNLSLHIRYIAHQPLHNVSIGFNLYENEGYVLLNFNTEHHGGNIPFVPQVGDFVCEVPKFPLRTGRYFGNIQCSVNGVVADWVQNAFRLDVEDGDFFGSGRLVTQGRIVAHHSWHVRENSDGEDDSRASHPAGVVGCRE
jgi:lipopolysaccharide transport system ATP-binding protein